MDYAIAVFSLENVWSIRVKMNIIKYTFTQTFGLP